MTCHQHPPAGEVPIPGGRMTSGIVRRGDRLLRPMGPWSPAVHEYLRHLEAAGFAGSPRVLGTESNREVLMAPPRQLCGAGFDALPDLSSRLRTFVDAYGPADRKVILPGLQRCRPDQREQLRWLQDIAADLARTL